MKIRSRELGFCIFCEQPVFIDDDYYNLTIDKPLRLDIPTHRSCYKSYRDNKNIKLFLQEHLVDYLKKYYEEDDGKKKTTHNRQKAKNR